MGNELPRPPPR